MMQAYLTKAYLTLFGRCVPHIHECLSKPKTINCLLITRKDRLNLDKTKKDKKLKKIRKTK